MQPFFGTLQLPSETTTLLWDMDGVLIDSLGLDQKICGELFTRHGGHAVSFAPELIRSLFALDPTAFIVRLAEEAEKETGGIFPERAALIDRVLQDYLDARRTTPFSLLPGVDEALCTGKARGLKMGVVSNNPSADLQDILKRSSLHARFDVVIGNDLVVEGRALRKKPEPDFYLHACSLLAARPAEAVVFEDSVLGARAGLASGAHVVGLLTGSAGRADMEALVPRPHQIRTSLLEV